jgi:hypothetical protein
MLAPCCESSSARVRDGQVDQLREWMRALMSRQAEVRQTFEQEGVRHEAAYLLEAVEGPVLVYAIELQDEAHAMQAFESSTLPIDLEHRRRMNDVLAGRGSAAVELLYEALL